MKVGGEQATLNEQKKKKTRKLELRKHIDMQ